MPAPCVIRRELVIVNAFSHYSIIYQGAPWNDRDMMPRSKILVKGVYFLLGKIKHLCKQRFVLQQNEKRALEKRPHHCKPCDNIPLQVFLLFLTEQRP